MPFGGYQCERDGARLLDARTLFHYCTIVVTPAMEAEVNLDWSVDIYVAPHCTFMPAMSMQAVLDAHPRDYGVSETGGMYVYVEPGEGRSMAIGPTDNIESVLAPDPCL